MGQQTGQRILMASLTSVLGAGLLGCRPTATATATAQERPHKETMQEIVDKATGRGTGPVWTVLNADNPIRSPEKSVYAEKGFVILEGRWKLSASNAFSPAEMLSVLNTTHIYCNKNFGTCTEIIAMLASKLDKLTLSRVLENILLTDSHEYQILDWSDNVVRAIEKLPVADLELRISLADKSAERSSRETKAYGAKDANPNVFYRWVLE